MHLTNLFIHPVKSLRGCAVSSAAVDALGLIGDRRFMVVEDETGRFLTQRALPRMALIETELSEFTLTLSAPGQGAIAVARTFRPTAREKPQPVVVSVWASEGLLAEDCGDVPAAWLGDFLGLKCRLVRIGEKFQRPVLKPGKARPGDTVSFADGYPLLVISEASLADLNDRLVAQGVDAVPMNRFRPNLVVAGCAAFAEDTWARFQIGKVLFRGGGPCGRCVLTTTDQLTAERGLEPLRTLAAYRRGAADPSNVNFGQNLFNESKSGMLRVGDTVTLL
ncbi:MAG: MOSC domain-containing protein [Opitutus sp.]|nr:MOSC domain-containing protein [Opitutus sp.]